MHDEKENWEKLCQEYNIFKENNRKINEEEFRAKFFLPALRNIFKWKQGLKDEVSIRIGRETKRADLVLEKDDIKIVIEFKNPNDKKGIDYYDVLQLWGYMGILRARYGFLIGKEIQAIYEDDKRKMKCSKKFSLDDDKNDAEKLGEEFVKILHRSSISDENLKEYMVEIPREKLNKEQKNYEKMLKENDKIFRYFQKKGYSIRQNERHKEPFFTERPKNKISWVLTPKVEGYEFKWETCSKYKKIIFHKKTFNEIQTECNKIGKEVIEDPGGKNSKDPRPKIYISDKESDVHIVKDIKDVENILKITRHYFGWPKIID